MKALWQRVRWQAAVVAATLLVFFALANHEAWWDYLGIEHAIPFFFDLVVLLAAGTAWHVGADPYALHNHFDPAGRPHVYGPWWLLSGPLGLTTDDNLWLGWTLLIVFLIAAVLVLAPRDPRAALVAALLLTSPPMLLAIERGNNDLVVFLLFAAAGALQVVRRPVGPRVAAGLFGLAAVLKLYPLAALPAMVARPVARQRALVALGTAVFGCLLVFLLWRQDYARILALVPQPSSIITFGWQVGLFAWQRLPDDRLWVSLGALIGLTGVGWFFWRQARQLWHTVPATGMVAAWYVAGALAWILCFLLNTNYTYRAVLLLLPARRWFDQAAETAAQGSGVGSQESVGGLKKDGEGAQAARIQLAAWLGVFWLVPMKAWWASGIDNHDVPGSKPKIAFVLGLEQTVLAGLTIALALGVVGWGWRRWHHHEPGE